MHKAHCLICGTTRQKNVAWIQEKRLRNIPTGLRSLLTSKILFQELFVEELSLAKPKIGQNGPNLSRTVLGYTIYRVEFQFLHLKF